jgi:electron transport complex protein RnfG
MSENNNPAGKKRRGGYLAQAWLILALALLFGSALAAVQVVLSPVIDRNKLEETLLQVPNLVPGAETGQEEQIGGQIVYRALDEQGNLVGWVLPASGQGFADKIELLVGLDAALETITGIYILDQKETPGLGNRIAEDEWRAQFRGKPTSKPLELSSADSSIPHHIEALTGATISSESVKDIVNDAVASLTKALSETSGG